MKYSVVILLEEMEEDFLGFLKNLDEVFRSRNELFETLVMANGTGRFLRTQLRKAGDMISRVKAFEFNTRTTQAICLRAALEESNGDIVVVCGSYQQLTNDSLRTMLDSLDEDIDFISPYRFPRIDPPFNQFQSRVFNGLVRKMTGTDFHDLSCSVKIFRREVLEEIDIYGNMYRFLPVLAARKGFSGREVKCQHHEERAKKGLYSLHKYIRILIDMFALYFNVRFSKKPLRFFSAIGAAFLLVGLIVMSYVFVQRMFMGHPIGNRPILFVAILVMVVGVLVSSSGLLGEIIAFTHGRQKKEYNIEKEI